MFESEELNFDSFKRERFVEWSGHLQMMIPIKNRKFSLRRSNTFLFLANVNSRSCSPAHNFVLVASDFKPLPSFFHPHHRHICQSYLICWCKYRHLYAWDDRQDSPVADSSQRRRRAVSVSLRRVRCETSMLNSSESDPFSIVSAYVNNRWVILAKV